MTIAFYPSRLLVTALFLTVFGAMLAVATDVEAAVAGAGAVAVIAYLVVELFVLFNPAAWDSARRPKGHG